MKIVQADTETRRRTWSMTNAEGAVVTPSTLSFIVRGASGDVAFTTTNGVVNNGDGTGTWTIAAGDLAVGQYEWWALATIGTETVIPRALSGKLEITDR